jgi:hypothetical protein
LAFSVGVIVQASVMAGHSRVMRGLDPRIHHLAKTMDCRVKPGNDK